MLSSTAISSLPQVVPAQLIMTAMSEPYLANIFHGNMSTFSLQSVSAMSGLSLSRTDISNVSAVQVGVSVNIRSTVISARFLDSHTGKNLCLAYETRKIQNAIFASRLYSRQACQHFILCNPQHHQCCLNEKNVWAHVSTIHSDTGKL